MACTKDLFFVKHVYAIFFLIIIVVKYVTINNPINKQGLYIYNLSKIALLVFPKFLVYNMYLG